MSTRGEGPERPDVEIVERRVDHQGFFRMDHFRLRHRLYNGEMSPLMSRELFERGDAAALLPYDPVRDEVVLLEQFRIGALGREGGPWLLEIVAGMIEEGETAERVIEREAMEEAGLTLGRVVHICDYLVSPGGTSEKIFLYCAEVDARGVEGIYGLADEVEDIRVVAVPFDETWALFEAGRIDSASPIIALQWLQRERSRLRREWRRL